MLHLQIIRQLAHNRSYLLAASFFVALFLGSWGNTDHSVNSIKAGAAAYQLSVTKHQLYSGTQRITYQAATGYMTLKRSDGKLAADIFYVSYQACNNNGPSNSRPVTFVFNGGPGSASIWLHMGSFGPVRVTLQNDNAKEPGKLGQYDDNPYTWLGFTDLVFIDPVSTGYSHAQDSNDAQFHNYTADISSIGQFIKQYLTLYRRQNSPKFLIGESYGAARAVGLTAYLQNEYKIAINGLTLISPALNYQLINFRHGNETPYSYYLPSYAVTAQYHGLLAPRLQKLSKAQLLAKAASFAQGTYALYLNQGDMASPQLTNTVVDSLHYFTSLSKNKLTELNARVTDSEFCKQLLKKSGKVIGGFDSRFTGDTQQNTNADPSETALRKLFTAAFDRYIIQNLKYQNNLPYLATAAAGDWNYGPDATNSYLDLSVTLKNLMVQNPSLKINVACGLYDLATPVATTQYVIRHLGLNAQLRTNINTSCYPSGHMVYISDLADRQFQTDGKKFYQQTTNIINQ